MEYNDENMILLSGIQHFAFCPRQWALIHMEQIWMENVRTVEGKQMHERADDPFSDELRKGVRVVRALPLLSMKYGFRGVADVVEFHLKDEQTENTCVLKGRQGRWLPVPIEYKRGKPKPDDRDAVQLCAQAMALEEMLHVEINKGFLYYGQTKHREEVCFVQSLRDHVASLIQAMRHVLDTGVTPYAEKKKHCSLQHYCQPDLSQGKRNVKRYLEKIMQGGADW